MTNINTEKFIDTFKKYNSLVDILYVEGYIRDEDYLNPTLHIIVDRWILRASKRQKTHGDRMKELLLQVPYWLR